jgi:hypothetical protein
MVVYDTTRWAGLLGAEVGASAALTGPIFVAVLIIIASRQLSARIRAWVAIRQPSVTSQTGSG